MNGTKRILVLLLGLSIRYSLRFSAYHNQFSKRVEISTPVTGWNRVVEGISLKERQISPYSGDTFHESPIFLSFYEILFKLLNEVQIGWLFIFVDILTSIIMGQIVMKQRSIMFATETSKIEKAAKKDKVLDPKYLDESLVLKQNEELVGFWTECIYLLSPYSILACVGQSTAVLSNFLYSLTFLSATNGQRFISLFLLSLLTVNSLYPVILLPAIILIIEFKSCSIKQLNKLSNYDIPIQTRFVRLSILLSFTIYATFIGINILLCNILESNENYFQSVYGFLLQTDDLSPNIGLFWYFFTEMFDHFREFFVWVFQINTFIFVIPLTIRFYKSPFFLMLTLLFVHSIFKPYPTFSDFVLYLSLLPQWSHLFHLMKSTLVVSVIFALITVFLPIQWYLWIDLGTANANFYFGMTLAYNIAQIFLVTDLMFAFVKREFFWDNLFLYQLSQKTNKKIPVQLD